ncbi:hypothetical protein XENORESO_016690 [Xenotaenia resolanae]|uniref:Uncharacterized protein n=1 Tax=Xenotaenia resolanae TaxID=208358 RepID=A0ABV0W361_9TELE
MLALLIGLVMNSDQSVVVYLFVCLFVVYLFVPPSLVCHHAEVLPAFQPREGPSLLQLHPANISANVANCSSKNSADPGQKQPNPPLPLQVRTYGTAAVQAALPAPQLDGG